MYQSIEHMEPVQTKTTTTHSRLAIQQNHKVNKEEEVTEMGISMHVIETHSDIPDCMTTEEIQLATINDGNIGVLSNYLLHN